MKQVIKRNENESNTKKRERGRDKKKRRITGRKNYRRKEPHALTHAPYYRIQKLKNDGSICSLQVEAKNDREDVEFYR